MTLYVSLNSIIVILSESTIDKKSKRITSDSPKQKRNTTILTQNETRPNPDTQRITRFIYIAFENIKKIKHFSIHKIHFIPVRTKG